MFWTLGGAEQRVKHWAQGAGQGVGDVQGAGAVAGGSTTSYAKQLGSACMCVFQQHEVPWLT